MSRSRSRFLDDIGDAAQRRVAELQLRQMIHYGESTGCRRRDLLGYFGETSDDVNCGACDNCLEPRETWDGTVATQKLLSTVYRARDSGGRATPPSASRTMPRC